MIRVVFAGWLLALGSGCQSPVYEVPINAKLDTLSLDFTVPEAAENPLIGKPLKVRVLFPEEFRGRAIQTKIDLLGPDLVPAKNPKEPPHLRWQVRAPEELDLTPLGYLLENNDLVIKLGRTWDLRTLSYFESVAEPLSASTIARSAFPAVGKMKKVVDSYFFGLFVKENTCTVSVVGKNLVLTNAHCVHTEDDCSRATFEFSDYYERGFWGGRVVRAYSCKKIIASSIEHDFTLAQTNSDPSEHYQALETDFSDHIIPIGQRLVAISNNAVKQYKLCAVDTGFHHCVLKANSDLRGDDALSECFRFYIQGLACNIDVISGDSGSPVFDLRGKVVGLIWGGTNPASKSGTIIPGWAIGRILREQGITLH